MTKKLSAVDRQRVSNALTKCAAATKDIEKNEELAEQAYQILSKELGDNPGLFKAACQVYNSCKSIHKLSAADDNTRGDSFSILNVQDMCGRLSEDKAKSIRKAASAPAVFGKIERPTSEEPLQKAASASPRVSRDGYRMNITKEAAEDSYATFLIAELSDAEAFLYKSANAVRDAERNRRHALEMFVASMATESAGVRKDAAARLFANYGKDIDELITAFGEQRPMQKLASADYQNKYKGTPSLAAGKITESALAVLEAEKVLEARTKLHQEVLQKTANMVLDHCASVYGLGKKAAGEGGLAGLVVKSTAVKELAELFGGGDEDKEMAKEIFNTAFINNMVAHSHRRSFMRAAMTDSLAK